jgi:hypothetical protein
MPGRGPLLDSLPRPIHRLNVCFVAKGAPKRSVRLRPASAKLAPFSNAFPQRLRGLGVGREEGLNREFRQSHVNGGPEHGCGGQKGEHSA